MSESFRQQIRETLVATIDAERERYRIIEQADNEANVMRRDFLDRLRVQLVILEEEIEQQLETLFAGCDPKNRPFVQFSYCNFAGRAAQEPATETFERVLVKFAKKSGEVDRPGELLVLSIEVHVWGDHAVNHIGPKCIPGMHPQEFLSIRAKNPPVYTVTLSASDSYEDLLAPPDEWPYYSPDAVVDQIGQYIFPELAQAAMAFTQL